MLTMGYTFLKWLKKRVAALMERWFIEGAG